MDNHSGTTVSFVADRRVTALAGAGAVVALLLAVFADDGPGRLLFGVATAVLLGFAASDLVFSPRLTATTQQVTVLSPLARATLGWDEIEAVRVDTRARLGLRSVTLEVDAGETLIVLSRRALGADPEQAADLINALRPPVS